MPNRKMNPKSLENLTHDGRPQTYEEPKKRRYLSVTETGWSGAQSAIATIGCKGGVSEFLERLGRGEFVIVEASATETER